MVSRPDEVRLDRYQTKSAMRYDRLLLNKDVYIKTSFDLPEC